MGRPTLTLTSQHSLNSHYKDMSHGLFGPSMEIKQIQAVSNIHHDKAIKKSKLSTKCKFTNDVRPSSEIQLKC